MFSSKSILLIIVATLSTTTAFAPCAPASFALKTTSSKTRIYKSAALEEVNDFNIYSIANPVQQLAIKDEVVGDGDVAEKGKVLTMAYEGKLMSNGYMFDSGVGYSFRLGDGKVIPGWEQGLSVRIYNIVVRSVYIFCCGRFVARFEEYTHCVIAC
jgi:hypothetical protein